MNLYSKAYYLMEGGHNQFLLMVPLFLLSSFLDLIGISVLAPFIGLMIGNNEVYNLPILQSFFSFFDLPINKESLILILAKAIILIFLVKVLISLLVNHLIFKFSFDIATSLRTKLTVKYQNSSYSEYTKHNASKYIHNIFSIVEKFSQGFLLSLLRMVSETLVAISICILLISINPNAFILLIALFGFFGLFYQIVIGNRSQLYGKQSNDFSKKLIHAIDESMSGFKFIKVMKIQNFFRERVKLYSEKFALASRRYYFIQILPRYLFEILMAIFIVSVAIFKDLLVIPSEVLIVFATASLRLQPSISQIVHSYNQILYGKNSIDVLYADLYEQEKNSLIKKDFFEDESILIKFSNVSFAYPEEKTNVLNDISFEIKKGDCIGVIGESGSGKTTLIDLMLGLLEPSSGDLKYNKLWFESIFYNPQDVFLIEDNIKSNIAIGQLGSESINEIIRDSMRRTSLDGMLTKIDQSIGYKGDKLSGGQKQRVALARAFYFNRQIIIFDEATSALDHKTEMEVIRSLNKFKDNDATMIIISHNSNSLSLCDRVLKIEDGKINFL
jgi:ATP-binding cassette, subfamily B, bacterial PglK